MEPAFGSAIGRNEVRRLTLEGARDSVKDYGYNDHCGLQVNEVNPALNIIVRSTHSEKAHKENEDLLLFLPQDVNTQDKNTCTVAVIYILIVRRFWSEAHTQMPQWTGMISLNETNVCQQDTGRSEI